MSERPPLSDGQRDALIRTMTRQVNEAREQARLDAAQMREYERTIRVLSDDLAEVHKQLAAFQAGEFPEAPFVA